MKSRSELLREAKKQAVVARKPLRNAPFRPFRDDILKHFVRFHYWKRRINRLMRAREIQSVAYFSLCADTAFDARLFKQEELIDFKVQRPIPFAFCEYDPDRYDLLTRVFPSPCQGFFGRLEEIATDVGNEVYSKFWGSFPYDVINLDFWGDIHKAHHPTHNVFYAISAIVSQQAPLIKPYELWITWRAKPDRVELQIRDEYKGIISQNLKQVESFKERFEEVHKNINPNRLSTEDLVNIGFIKWLLFIANRSFSVIEEPEILLYTREDKDGKKYQLINFLLRIRPYEHVVMPSPAGQAASSCQDSYEENAAICFQEPIDVDEQYRLLPEKQKATLKKNLIQLNEQFENDKAGYLGRAL